MKPVKVLIFTQHPFAFWCFPESGLARLREMFPGVRFVLVRSRQEAVRELPDADVFLGWRFEESWLDLAPRLRWIHSPAAGVRRLMKPALIAHPVIITNARGMHATVIAEHVLALMILFSRKFHLCLEYQKQRRWGNHELIESPGGLVETAGRTVLILGYGAIGEALGRRARALDMKVWAIRKHPERETRYAHRVGGVNAVPEWLPEADFVVLTAPHTAETHGWFDAAAFAKMKPSAYFINVSRGHLVDEQALLEALRDGAIAGAALDVFQEEPLPPDSPLWDAPNLVITPHVAGVVTDKHWDRVLEGFAENLRRFLAGEPLRNVVDKTAGY